MKFAFCLVCLCLIGLPSAEAARVELRLLDEVTVDSSRYQLADIARIESADAGLRRDLAEAVIGHSPRPNTTARLTRSAILARLESLRPGISRQLTWQGESEVRLRTLGVAFDGDRLIARATEIATDWLARHYDDFEIAAVSRPRDLVLPPGAVRIKPRLPNPSPLKKRFSLWLDLYVDGRLAQSRPVWFSATIRDYALVATTAFERGETLTSSRLHRRYVDITTARGIVVDDIGTLAGLRLREPMAAGEILTRAMLQKRPAVIKGEQVRVSVSVGQVTLDTRAIALSDGYLDQKIFVKSPGSGEDYAVVVTGPSQTRVQ